MTSTGIDSEVDFYARNGITDGALEEMRREWCLTLVTATSADELSTDDLMVLALQIVTGYTDLNNVDDLWETMAVGDEAVVDIREAYYNSH